MIAGPLTAQEGLLVAEIDLEATRGPRWIFDAAGHYARPDIFQLTVNRAPQRILNADAGAGADRVDRRVAPDAAID